MDSRTAAAWARYLADVRAARAVGLYDDVEPRAWARLEAELATLDAHTRELAEATR